jgi:hypothetical protein
MSRAGRGPGGLGFESQRSFVGVDRHAFVQERVVLVVFGSSLILTSCVWVCVCVCYSLPLTKAKTRATGMVLVPSTRTFFGSPAILLCLTAGHTGQCMDGSAYQSRWLPHMRQVGRMAPVARTTVRGNSNSNE